MKKEIFRTLLVFLLVYTVLHAQDYAFNKVSMENYHDYTAIAAPSNPPAGKVRWYQNNATNTLTCIRSDGSNCTPLVDRTGDLLATTLNACPTGYTQYAAADGKAIVSTLSAHMDVGTTGGSDSLTPTGSLAMDAMDTHVHQLPIAIDDSNLVTQIAKSGVYGQGPDTHSTVQQLNNDGVMFADQPAALSEAVSAGTPTGTFTGDPADNRQSFIRVIECKKN